MSLPNSGIMREADSQHVWGVLGGMGPLASAEFMNTIYEQNIHGPEQLSPVVFLLSDPTIPDRTRSFANSEEHVLLQRLLASIERLVAAGATRIIVCCMTIHPLLCRLPAALQAKIISLVDVIFAQVLRGNDKHLLICTDGARKMKLFESHPLWPQARDRIVLPEESDQASIHRLIYDIKKNACHAGHWQMVEAMMKRYGVESYIAGCTEIHILTKKRAKDDDQCWRSCIDPLALVASRMAFAPSSRENLQHSHSA